MAVRDNRRKSGMTVGQRMRDFSRSVMRHYAPLPDDSIIVPASEPSAPSRPEIAPLAETSEVNTQFVASAPLPFDTPATESAAPLLPPAELPVYAPDPPLPQYVVPATPAPTVQRTEQPARTAGDIAMGPDGRPLMHNGRPIPVDHDPTPPALLELIRRDRERSAEVQRLKEERIEKLKTELPPAPEDADAPRSSRIRRRGSAEVDYIQTKALADKREPGDTAADPKPNNKSPREPEKPEAPSLDDDDESSGNDAESSSFELPTDAASPVTPSADISTTGASPAVQRVPDIETPAPFIPFDVPVDAPIDAPIAEPVVVPESSPEPHAPVPAEVPPAPPVAVQRQPDAQPPASPSPVDASQGEPPSTRPTQHAVTPDSSRHTVSTPELSPQPVQRQIEPGASPAPVSDKQTARDEGHPDILPAAPVQPTHEAVQRQAVPETAPSIPFDMPAEKPGNIDVSQAPSMPAPQIPSIQREPAGEVPSPSLPFDAPMIDQPDAPEIIRPLNADVPTPAQPTFAAPAQSAVPSVQRQADTDTAASLPLDSHIPEETLTRQMEQPSSPPVDMSPDAQLAAPSLPKPMQDAATDITPSQPEPTVQRKIQPETATPLIPFEASPEQPRASEQSHPLTASPDAASNAGTPAIQRQAEVDRPAPSLPFELAPEQQSISLSQAEQFAAQDAPQSPAAEKLSAPETAVQREPELDAAPHISPDVQPSSVEPGLAQAPAPTPPIQRDVEAAPTVQSLPFDTPENEQPAVSQVAAQAQTDVPAVQGLAAPEDISQPLTVDAPLVNEQVSVPDIPQPFPSPAPQPPAIQRQVDPDPASLPFDTTVSDLAMSDVPSAVSGTAQTFAPTAHPQPETAAPLPQAPAPSVQRQSETNTVASPLPFDVPTVSDDVQQPGQPAATASTPVSAIQREPAADASPPQSGASVPLVQRQTDVETDSSGLPFEIPPVATVDTAPSVQSSTPHESSQAAEPSSLAPAIQRQMIEAPASPLPFNGPQPEQSEPSQGEQAVMQDVSHVERPASLEVPPQAVVPPAAAPVVQRQITSETAPNPLPFDSPPADHAPFSPVEPVSTAPDISTPEATSAFQTSMPTVQRQIDTVAPTSEPAPVPLPFDPPADHVLLSPFQPVSAAPDISTPEAANASKTSMPAIQRQIDAVAPTPEPVPDISAPEAVSVSQTLMPAVQRQADSVAPAPAPEAAPKPSTVLPFDDLDTAAVQPIPVHHAAPPIVLPFDPVSPAEAPAVQRTAMPESDDPFSTPNTMPAGVPPEGRMDVFQALVAAGTVSRPPGGSTMPTAQQPLLQRSPSREAYLATMAQRQESAGAVSGPIQRALDMESEANPPAPEQEDEQAPEIDVNRLASDVMRMLRGKLRSEHERLSKR